METDNEIVRKFMEEFNQTVKFYDSYLLCSFCKIYRYKYITEINVYIIVGLTFVGIHNKYTGDFVKIFESYDRMQDEDIETIRDRIIEIFMINMNKMSDSNKQLEEISKKMDVINEKLEAIVYAPGSSLYKEIAAKYAEDEKK